LVVAEQVLVHLVEHKVVEQADKIQFLIMQDVQL
jgi:hypothetical protein